MFASTNMCMQMETLDRAESETEIDTDYRGSPWGMAAMLKQWSDPGHSPFLDWNVSYNCVYFMSGGEAHLWKSHYGTIHTVILDSWICSYSIFIPLHTKLRRINITGVSLEIYFLSTKTGMLIAEEAINTLEPVAPYRYPHQRASGCIEMNHSGMSGLRGFLSPR